MTGIFVVAATIVRCTLALVDPAQITAIIWSIRETVSLRSILSYDGRVC